MARQGFRERIGASLWASRHAVRRVERAEVRRFTRRARTRRAAWLGGAGLVLFLAVFVGVAIFTPLLSVRDVRVTGLERQDEAEVLAALDDLRGQPLAQVTDAKVGARLEPFVLVQSYSVRSEPPSTLVVEIVERVPVGVVPADEGYTAVDGVGTRLWPVDAVPEDLPLVKAKNLESPGFEAAAAASLALEDEFRAQVATIDAHTFDSVRLTLRDGTEVLWGSAEESARKAQVLEALVAATGGDATYYDVSSPEAPVSR